MPSSGRLSIAALLGFAQGLDDRFYPVPSVAGRGSARLFRFVKQPMWQAVSSSGATQPGFGLFHVEQYEEVVLLQQARRIGHETVFVLKSLGQRRFGQQRPG